MLGAELLNRRVAASSLPSEALLELFVPGHPSRRISLHGGLYRLGRDSRLEVWLDHPAVSKRHALLEQIGSDWLLRDDGSTNGLYWRGQRISQLLLRDGDAVRFGPATEPGLPELVFQRRPQPRLPTLFRVAAATAAAVASAGMLLLGFSVVLMPVRGSLAPVRGPVALYDRLNRPLSSADSSEHRENKALSNYPRVLIEALLASEDSRFWWHPGVDPIGTGRALVTNLLG
ncbi:MAG: peptidoglycan glycosyltransferase, partial [Cyanobium sp.]